MRNKKAKELRKLARKLTVGIPNRKYKWTGFKGKQINFVLTKDCTRGVYKRLKRKYLTFCAKDRQGVILDLRKFTNSF